MADLDQVKGINARQIKMLQESGISSAEALAMSNTETVSSIEGLGDKTAKKLIWNARSALGMTEFVSAKDINENVEYITTGSSELNRILGGGFQTGKLTEVYGPFKSGKTNLGHTLAVTVQLPKEKGGLKGAVVYIDTENTFSKEKIKRIAKRFNLDPKKVLENIFHARIYSSDHQSQMIAKAETLCKNRNARLLIVDSLTALMRAEYVGIGMLARRQNALNTMIHALSRIAETYNCAILLTNQVATKMMGMFSGDDAIGGNIVAHGCHFRVSFKTKGFSSNSSLKRKAIIVDAPDLPPEECEFYITSAGVADTEDSVASEEDSPKEDFEIEKLYENETEDVKEIEKPKENNNNIKDKKADSVDENDIVNIPLTNVKGIGEGTFEKLKQRGINTISDLLKADPDELSSQVTGITPKKVSDWQKFAQTLIQT